MESSGAPEDEPPGESSPGNPAPKTSVPLHPQLRALLEAMAADPEQAPPADLAAERASYLDDALRLGGAAEPVAATEDVVVPSGEARLPARLYVPQHEPQTTGLLVWLHGGGWYLGDIATHDGVARALANASGQKVLLVEYRLAPEHRWPVPAQDAVAAVAWARSPEGAEQLGTDAGQVAAGGDSAGGNLAVVAARHARADGRPALRALLLAYPALDTAMDSDAYREHAENPLLKKADMERCWSLYLDGQDPRHPDADPLAAGDDRGMPPAWIAVAGQDPVRDDGIRYAAALRAAGVPVQERVYDDMAHGFLRWAGVVDRTRELVEFLAGGARSALT